MQSYSEKAITDAVAFASIVLDSPLGRTKLAGFCYKFVFDAWWQP